MKKLSDLMTLSVILCYKEDVSELQSQLALSGLKTTVYRACYTADQLRYPAATRCFMSHRAAWEIASKTPGYTLICEADFVPCRRLGELPVFWPEENSLAWGYLYQGSPRLLSLIGRERYLRGHCAPLVAYIINSKVAEIMLRFYDSEIAKYGTEQYFTFDAHLQWWVMGQGAEAFIPLRNYGEHGGMPNPEHAKSPLVKRAGKHRADTLAAPLAFLPQYAQGSRLRYYRERAEGRLFGWARLLTGRWIVDTNVYTRDWRATFLMLWLGFIR